MKKIALMITVAMSVLVCSPAAQADDLAKDEPFVCAGILMEFDARFDEWSKSGKYQFDKKIKAKFDKPREGVGQVFGFYIQGLGISKETATSALRRASLNVIDEVDAEVTSLIAGNPSYIDQNGGIAEVYFASLKKQFREKNCFKLAHTPPTF
jgi:hypothetical protein